MDIKGHTVHRVMVAAGAPIAEEYYVSLLLDRAERRYLAMASVEGGVEIEQLAVERPEALARVPVDPTVGIDAAKAAEIVAAAGFDARRRGPGRRGAAEAVDRVPRGGRDAGRGQPAGQDRGRPRHRAGRQGHPGRQRGVPAPRPRRAESTRRRPTRWRPRPRSTTSTTSSSTASVGIIGNGAGLVMSTLDVVA